MEELAAAGEELAADTIPVEAAKKEEKGVYSAFLGSFASY